MYNIQIIYSIKLKNVPKDFNQFISNKKYVSKWFLPLESINQNSKFKIKGNNVPPLFNNGIVQIERNLKEDSTIWKCKFHSHCIDIFFELKNGKLTINCELSTNLHLDHFIDIYNILFYRLLFILEDIHFIPDLLYIPNTSDSIELSVNVYSNAKKIFKSITHRKYVSKIFSKYPEVNLNKFIYNWGWIDEGPSNLIHYTENEKIIYDFYLNYEPIGVVKWIISEETNNMSKLTIIFQDLIMHTENNPIEAFNSYRLGWLLLLYKVKDFSERGQLSLKIIK